MPTEQTLTNYVPVVAAFLLATVVAGVMVFLSHLIGRLEAKPKRTKLMPYECGIDPVGDARGRFPVKFYVIAMLFIVFDIEIVFFYPWATVYRHLGMSALAAMALFLTVLVVGYVYLLRVGAFEWEWWEREAPPEELTAVMEQPTEMPQTSQRTAVPIGGEN